MSNHECTNDRIESALLQRLQQPLSADRAVLHSGSAKADDLTKIAEELAQLRAQAAEKE